ncbi:MAG TPA: EamA family transporter [Solirubrobacteraceae bacterium]|nr:EamA family transporter [Solirubrobacteraceae bacterium]
MAILFALVSAACYGTSDFCAGLLSRRYAAEPASALIIALEILGSALAVALYPGHGPSVRALAWGAVSGLGGGTGTLFLYRGLAAGAMTVVGTVSGVLAAVVPVLVGLALGNHLTAGEAAGIAIAVPAIALVSWQPHAEDTAGARSAAVYGALAGCGFALLFVGLDRAGTRAGAWPLLPGQAVGFCVVAPFALRRIVSAGRPELRDLPFVMSSGVLASAAALFFLVASGHGELSIVAVIAALYPAFTVVLARAVLSERWSPTQAFGLLIAAASVVLVSVS